MTKVVLSNFYTYIKTIKFSHKDRKIGFALLIINWEWVLGAIPKEHHIYMIEHSTHEYVNSQFWNTHFTANDLPDIQMNKDKSNLIYTCMQLHTLLNNVMFIYDNTKYFIYIIIKTLHN